VPIIKNILTSVSRQLGQWLLLQIS